jgi:ribosomal protein L37E
VQDVTKCNQCGYEAYTSFEYCPACGIELSQNTRAIPTDSQSHKDSSSINKSLFSKEEMKALFFLLSGAIFFIFGFILLFHIKQDVFSLSWKTSSWPLFLIPSLFLLKLGWKNLQQTKEDYFS